MTIKVRVRNFQSVEDAEITIDGLTVVTGTNNAGKSAFFRAIRGAFVNARGYDFVRHGQDHCIVDLTFDDDKTLTWKKGKNINTYIVNKGKPLQKVGVGVPPEAQIFGVEPVVAGKTELWPQIAPQITGVSFLLHETGSVIAEAVADVKRVNQLSRALSACGKDQRAARAELKTRRADAVTLAERAEKFVGLDAMVDVVTELEDRKKKADKVVKAVTNVAKLQARYKKARGAVDALAGLDAAEAHLPKKDVLKRAQEVSQALQVAAKLKGRWDKAAALVEALDGLEEAQEELPGADQIEKAQTVARSLRGGRKLQERYAAARGRVNALAGVEEAQEALPSDSRVQYAQQFRKGVQITVELALKVESARKELRTAEAAQAVFAELDFDEGPVVKAGKFKKALANAANLKSRYTTNRDAVADLERQIRDQEAELEKLSQTLAGALGDVDECPTCGGGLDHVH